MHIARGIRSPARLSTIGLATCAIAAELAAQTPQRAVAALSSAVPAERLRALTELERYGAAALPALIQALEKATAGEPRKTIAGRLLFDVNFDSDRPSHEHLAADAEYACDDWQPGFELAPRSEAAKQRAAMRRELAWFDGKQNVVGRLLYAIAGNGERAAAAVPLLVDLLAHEHHAEHAARVLAAIGQPASTALLAAFGDRWRGHAAATSLAAVQRDRSDAAVRAALLQILINGRRSEREPAVTAIGLLGESATAAEAAAVAALLPTASEQLVRLASWALGRMGDVGAAEMQKLFAGGLDARRRSMLLAAVPLLGARARPLAAAVFAAADGAATAPVSRAFATALPGTAFEARAVEWLLAMATDGEVAERAAALRALPSFPAANRRTAAIAAAVCGREGFLLRSVACRVLARLRLRDEAAATATLAIVQREGLHVDTASAAALAQLGAIQQSDVGDKETWQYLDSVLRRAAVRAYAAVAGDPAPRLLEWLTRKGVEFTASDELGALGAPVVERLSAIVGDAEHGFVAARALARAGDKGIAALVARLADPDSTIAMQARNAVSNAALGHQEVMGAVVALLRTGSEAQRDAAAEVLAGIDMSAAKKNHVDAVLAAAAEAPAARRAELVTALETVTTDRVVAFLVRAVGDDDGEVRCRAIRGLGDYHDVERPEVQKAMLRALGDGLPSVRTAAAHALATTYGSDPAIAAALRRIATATLAEERAAGLEALGMFRGEAASALPLLTAALADNIESVRFGALAGLRNLGPLATEEQNRVLSLLRRDKAKDHRIAAIEALAAMRPEYEDAWDLMADRVRRGDEAPGKYGGRPGRIGDLSPTQLRTELMSGVVPRILEAARQATWMGARGKELLPDLVALLGHAEVDVRAAVVAAIGRVGGDDAMPLLVGALGDTAATVRVAALDQLRVIDKKFAATVFAPIANCIGDADGKVRKAAVEALGATALRDRSFQRELEHSVQILLADTVPAVRIAAAEALTELDHLNAATLATLVPLLDHGEPLVRLAGVRALRAAGAAAASHATRVLELGRAGDPAMAGAALRALAAIAPDREDGWWFAVERLQDRAFVGAAQADAAYLLLGL